ncbi:MULTISPECIES: hypothetical protein [Brevibacterium]|uniref:Uncharacterized protein n=1 Tax=Brevibacterium salitolerans TaxID=1403566 RepID=A0ABN2WZG5_9MICO|nr:hypothetical protein [Brevibacterium sp.]
MSQPFDRGQGPGRGAPGPSASPFGAHPGAHGGQQHGGSPFGDAAQPGPRSSPFGAPGADLQGQPAAGTGAPGGSSVARGSAGGTAQGAPGDPFGTGAPQAQAPAAFGAEVPRKELTVSGPPLAVLWAALVAAVVGVGVALLPWGPTSPVGWLFAGPVAILLLGRYGSEDVRRRTDSLYATHPAAVPLYWAAVAVTVLAVLATALLTAFWVGRL